VPSSSADDGWIDEVEAMSKNISRRGFISGAVAAGSAGVAFGMSPEDRILLAREKIDKAEEPPKVSGATMQMGKIGDLEVSRIICGGNLIGGYAHSRDLMYVSDLLSHYFTEEKIFDTLELCEQNGINTVMTEGQDGIGVINKYWRERGGKIQWITQDHVTSEDYTSQIQASIDNGACGVHIQGHVSDHYAKQGQAGIDLLGKAVDFIHENGVPAGIACHELHVPVECEKAGLNPDYYMKTLHSKDYWSSQREQQTREINDSTTDNYWCRTPDKVIEFMKTVEKPWIAYKVLAAGAIHPADAFKYTFENGADFATVGMFDWQIAEDVQIANEVLASVKRTRPWRA
jgi:hypothetical protein